jgi:hypothetical protein
MVGRKRESEPTLQRRRRRKKALLPPLDPQTSPRKLLSTDLRLPHELVVVVVRVGVDVLLKVRLDPEELAAAGEDVVLLNVGEVLLESLRMRKFCCERERGRGDRRR